ncbi:hypothetical protein NQ317_010583 [Molorchus minor]|uniref:Uncharacterized protein n=1 Tax=Molorchus minor TaxID=1323400 RepID=A0ABQ9J8Z2_9CUCU|nr:hypothetical protein NQ317_010583 [Molorchus minor]
MHITNVIKHQPTTLTFNGRSSLEEPKTVPENVYCGLDTQINRPQSRISPHDLYESDNDTESCHQVKYHSFSRYTTPRSKDNWSYSSTMAVGPQRNSQPSDNKYIRRSLNKKYNKRDSTRPRPKPLQYENEKYYDHVFPKRDGRISTDIFYQPNSLEHAEFPSLNYLQFKLSYICPEANPRGVMRLQPPCPSRYN